MAVNTGRNSSSVFATIKLRISALSEYIAKGCGCQFGITARHTVRLLINIYVRVCALTHSYNDVLLPFCNLIFLAASGGFAGGETRGGNWLVSIIDPSHTHPPITHSLADSPLSLPPSTPHISLTFLSLTVFRLSSLMESN